MNKCGKIMNRANRTCLRKVFDNIRRKLAIGEDMKRKNDILKDKEIP